MKKNLVEMLRMQKLAGIISESDSSLKEEITFDSEKERETKYVDKANELFSDKMEVFKGEVSRGINQSEAQFQQIMAALYKCVEVLAELRELSGDVNLDFSEDEDLSSMSRTFDYFVAEMMRDIKDFDYNVESLSEDLSYKLTEINSFLGSLEKKRGKLESGESTD